MKYTTTIILATFLFIGSSVRLSAQSNSAVEYMDEAVASIDGLKNETWQYLKSVTQGKSARNVDKKRQDLLSAIKSQKSKAKRMKGYQSDDRLKNAVVNYLDLSYTVLKEDYDKILDMEDISEQSYDAMEAYLLAKEQANQKLNEAFQSVIDAQQAFADAHEIKLVNSNDDKTVEKIKKANAALKYYNEVYLIFFKSYKQDLYVVDALQRQDVSGIEQNASALSATATEGLEKLKSIQKYRGDGSLKLAVDQALKFYVRAGNEDYPSQVDFFIKKDNFEKVQKMVESKGKKDRTQDDIDKYNAASGEYNEAVEKYNETNQRLNNDRSNYLMYWNDKSKHFFEVHTN